MAQEKVKVRQSNMELLRILAMLMIITLHYLDKGNVLVPFGEMTTLNHYVAWILEAFCYVAVNVYVLISGYFLVQSKFTFKKLVVLWLQILFYSWLIGGIYILSGMVDKEALNLYELIFVVFPVTAGHYWFATIYVLLFATFPFLNAAVSKMSRQQHKACIIVLVVIFSAWKTILPFTIPITDQAGMDIAWFVCLYVIAAYLRKYPECMKHKKYLYMLGYLLCSITIFLVGLIILYADKITGKLGGYATNWYDYNSLPVLLGSVCLFVVFVKTDLKGKNINKIINTLAGATFGVYLIHEHRYIRYEWPQWLNVEQNAGQPWMLLHLVGSIIVVFLVCSCVELVRKWIFSLITECKWFQKLFKPLAKVESKINGDAE